MFTLLRDPPTRLTLTLVFFCLALSQQTSAQAVSPALVIVADPTDAACTQRIGNEHVQVQLLFPTPTDARPSNYHTCSQRVRELVNFQLLIFRSDCPGEVFWRDRIATANPRGRSYRLSHSRCDKLTPSEKEIQRAYAIHSALAAVLPNHRKSLDANLKMELRRLRASAVPLHQLVARD